MQPTLKELQKSLPKDATAQAVVKQSLSELSSQKHTLIPLGTASIGALTIASAFVEKALPEMPPLVAEGLMVASAAVIIGSAYVIGDNFRVGSAQRDIKRTAKQENVEKAAIKALSILLKSGNHTAMKEAEGVFIPDSFTRRGSTVKENLQQYVKEATPEQTEQLAQKILNALPLKAVESSLRNGERRARNMATEILTEDMPAETTKAEKNKAFKDTIKRSPDRELNTKLLAKEMLNRLETSAVERENLRKEQAENNQTKSR